MIIHIRLSGLELFTFLMDSLIEVKLRYISCRIIQICKGGGWKHRKPEPDSRKWQRCPLQHRRDINLAKDKESEELVTAQSWILSPQCHNLTEYILSYIVMRTVAQAAALLPVCQASHLQWRLRWHIVFFVFINRSHWQLQQPLFLC